VAERQILLDTINVGWSEERRFSQRSAAFGAFTLKQMPFASAVEQDLAGTCYLEPFGHRFPGFNAFGASHICSLSLSRARNSPRAQDGFGALRFSSLSPANWLN
jgi:hypothetical protein